MPDLGGRGKFAGSPVISIYIILKNYSRFPFKIVTVFFILLLPLEIKEIQRTTTREVEISK